jgi:hypothetical protein
MIIEELQRRIEAWSKLKQAGAPTAVTPGLLRELRIYGGASGVWVDKERTQEFATEGVTVGLLHTGTSYPDDLSEDGIIYHYPVTNRSDVRDSNEVAATKAAKGLGLPVFVITPSDAGPGFRGVRLAWVEDWVDEEKWFFASFGDQPSSLPAPAAEDDSPFSLFDLQNKKKGIASIRTGQTRFKYQVLRRYGAKCAACDIAVPQLLDAAHLCPKKANGSDDPRNGLVLCASHHRAFDAGLFKINPHNMEFIPSAGFELNELGISNRKLALAKAVRSEALSWRWENPR